MQILPIQIAHQERLAAIKSRYRTAASTGAKECQRCGFCCRKKPCSLRPDEVEEIAGYLGKSISDFVKDNTVADQREGSNIFLRFAAQEQTDLLGKYVPAERTFTTTPCIMFDGKDNSCRIYPVRPIAARRSKCWEEARELDDPAWEYWGPKTIYGYIPDLVLPEHKNGAVDPQASSPIQEPGGRMGYDVILMHPPAIYDFREKAVFPGPVGYTVGGGTGQFIIPPIGMLSIADYLDRNGYKVRVDNIGERMIASASFNVEEHIGNLSAKVYGIGLNWCVHSQGAIEIARLCKKLHPDAMVVLGGLTATVFHEEIVSKFEFVDAVIRAEAEKPFLALMKALEQHTELERVPSLTFRDGAGSVKTVPLMQPSVDLDEFEFTRLDLLEPKGAIFHRGVLANWSIPICRGCTYNCVSCGGSAYSYKTHLGREKPAFRSPEKIAQDLRKLGEQGVQLAYLFQDPRMGGRKYWRDLLSTLQNETITLTRLTMELFGPADEEYIRELAKIGVPVGLTMSSESGVDSVRGAHGRKYTNEQLLRTIEICKRYGISLGIFSMAALANDTSETIKATWASWEQICSLNLNENAPVDYAFGPMILLDPGSLAFDRPTSYDYRLTFKNFEDYYQGMSLPSWHQWLSYETQFLDGDAITKLFIDSLEFSINLRERCGFYTKVEADTARFCFVEAGKETIDVVNDAMTIDDQAERSKRLVSFRESLDSRLAEISARS